MPLLDEITSRNDPARDFFIFNLPGCDNFHQNITWTSFSCDYRQHAGDHRSTVHYGLGIYYRVAHDLTGDDASSVAYRPAVGHLFFEGVGIFPNGVMYYGDENLPSWDTGGGVCFRFIPSSPWMGGAAVKDLDESPLMDGLVYRLCLSRRSGNTDYGQGSELGKDVWIEIENSKGAKSSRRCRRRPQAGRFLPYGRPQYRSVVAAFRT